MKNLMIGLLGLVAFMVYSSQAFSDENNILCEIRSGVFVACSMDERVMTYFDTNGLIQPKQVEVKVKEVEGSSPRLRDLSCFTSEDKLAVQVNPQGVGEGTYLGKETDFAELPVTCRGQR